MPRDEKHYDGEGGGALGLLCPCACLGDTLLFMRYQIVTFIVQQPRKLRACKVQPTPSAAARFDLNHALLCRMHDDDDASNAAFYAYTTRCNDCTDTDFRPCLDISGSITSTKAALKQF